PVWPCSHGVGLALPDTVPGLPPPPPPPPQLPAHCVAVGCAVGDGASVGDGSGVCELAIGEAASAPAGTVAGVLVGNVRPAASLPVPVPDEPSPPPGLTTQKPATAVLAATVRMPRQAQSSRIATSPTAPEMAARYWVLVSQRCWKPYTRLSSHESRLIRPPPN